MKTQSNYLDRDLFFLEGLLDLDLLLWLACGDLDFFFLFDVFASLFFCGDLDGVFCFFVGDLAVVAEVV